MEPSKLPILITEEPELCECDHCKRVREQKKKATQIGIINGYIYDQKRSCKTPSE